MTYRCVYSILLCVGFLDVDDWEKLASHRPLSFVGMKTVIWASFPVKILSRPVPITLHMQTPVTHCFTRHLSAHLTETKLFLCSF